MTKDQFHSFIKLVRLMHNKQQESYCARNNNANLIAQAKALELKVAGKFKEFIDSDPQHYDWQSRFVKLVKEVRAQQAMYYATRYDSVLIKCRAAESQLSEAIKWLESKHPQIFQPLAIQSSLYDH
ncbi:MAG: hypothetical protein IPK62_13685 [Bacteroidetes bacterium]|nr:hypothetical protein [Bacteroidota bacterium]